MLATPAMAQGEPAEPPRAPEAGETGLQDIVVTARRRSESLQDTPVAITAVSSSMLESMGTTKIADLQGQAPNLLITQQVSGAAAANISIRGLSFADIEKSFDPTVAVVVDGVFIGTSTGQFMDMFDIESIEVLRGPQGNLFGRNTIGGVINIRRTRPKNEFSGKFQVEYGNFDTFSGRAVLHVPVSDTVSAKLFGFHTRTDGFYDYFADGSPRGGGRNWNYGVAIGFEPTAEFDALLTVEQQESTHDNGVSSISGTGELFCAFALPIECDRNTTSDLYTTFSDPSRATYKSPAVTLEMNYDAGGVGLTSITSYRESEDSSFEDVDGLTENLYRVDRSSNYRQFSQELRAAGEFSDTFDYVVGAYYFDSHYNLDQYTDLFGGGFYRSQYTVGDSTSYAFFGDFNWEVLPTVRVNFGGRWTKDKKALQTMAPDATGTFADFGRNSKSWSKFTPKVSVDFRPTDDLMFYASWSRGYRSGGFSGRGLDFVSATTPFNPETVDSYEVGLKSEWLDNRLIFNLAAFFTKYDDIQQNITKSGGSTGNITIVENAASAEVKGIEADMTILPVDRLTIRAALGLLDTKFKGFVNQEAYTITDADGNVVEAGLHTYDYSAVDMIYAPDITASINFSYEQPLGTGELRLNGSYRYIDPYDQQISRDARIPVVQNSGTTVLTSNDPRVRTDKQNLLDASITYSIPVGDGEANVTVFGRNLLDDRGAATAFTVAGLWSFATAREPRAYGVSVGYEF
ncbi:TonB-dependent receptor [Novosphingobium marinum]|nr:TonB-dependent receptor [Novosphingobium marinum]